MVKKIFGFLVVVFFLANFYGCFALLAGAAGGAGTAAWFSGKLTQEVNAPFEKTVKAAERGLKSMKLDINKETKEKEITQIMSKYYDGKTIWIDIRRVTDISSRIDIRVGAVNGDKKASDEILKKIQHYL